MIHTCPNCGAAHKERVKTDRERIADLEAEVQELRAKLLDALTHRCHDGCWHTYYWPTTTIPQVTWTVSNGTADLGNYTVLSSSS